MTQTDRIERHMRDYGSITTRDAYNEYGCTRLPARIFDLINKRGLHITKKMESGKNRYGESVSYARYSIVKEGD